MKTNTVLKCLSCVWREAGKEFSLGCNCGLLSYEDQLSWLLWAERLFSVKKVLLLLEKDNDKTAPGRRGWFFGLDRRFSSSVKFLPEMSKGMYGLGAPVDSQKKKRTEIYQQCYSAEESPRNNNRNPSGQMSLVQLENPRLQTGSPDGHKQLWSFCLNYGRRALSAWRVIGVWGVFMIILGLMMNTRIKTKLTRKGSTLAYTSTL